MGITPRAYRPAGGILDNTYTGQNTVIGYRQERWSLDTSSYDCTCIIGLREFECQSFQEFLTWKEKEEEDNNTFYAQSTGKKPFNDSTNDETGNAIITQN